MPKARPKQKAPLSVKLLNVLIILLAIVMLIALIAMVSNLNKAFNRDPYGSIEYDLRSGDYAYMVSTYYMRGFDIDPFSGPYEEYYYVAQYADAAFRRQFFLAVGDQEQSARLAERMDASRAAAGKLSVSTEDIDRLLETVRLYP